MNQQASEEEDPVLDRVAETSLRLMAGVVPKATLAALQKKVQGSASYPWEWVVDRVLQGPMAPEHLVKQGLRAQRDWILGGGRARPRKRLAVRSKTVFAWLLSRMIFFVLYTLAACAVLILVKQKWPEWDIYIVLKWLQQAFPGVFPPP